MATKRSRLPAFRYGTSHTNPKRQRRLQITRSPTLRVSVASGREQYRCLALGSLVAAFMAIGCGHSKRESVELGPPDLKSSRSALVASLDAWKADQRSSGVIIGSAPSIGIVDAMRTERRLLDYEVVGPLMVVEKGRPFAVRLILDAPRETVAARYIVLGRDPLWVFRQEDFERMLHWEHKMDPESQPLPAAPSTSGK